MWVQGLGCSDFNMSRCKSSWYNCFGRFEGPIEIECKDDVGVEGIKNTNDLKPTPDFACSWVVVVCIQRGVSIGPNIPYSFLYGAPNRIPKYWDTPPQKKINYNHLLH